MHSKKLVICGSGIKSLSHCTKEFETSIKAADIVVYLVNEPLLEVWLQKNSRKHHSLNKTYFDQSQRLQSYEKIVTEVLNFFDEHNNVCLVFYGHPLLLARPAHIIIKQATLLNIEIRILPGISSLDCLIADLKLDLNGGCFLAEATDLIKNKININPSNHVILWQIGMIDINSPPTGINKSNIFKLKNELLKYYLPESFLYFYEASIYPHLKPTITKTSVGELNNYNISPITTAYLPPRQNQ